MLNVTQTTVGGVVQGRVMQQVPQTECTHTTNMARHFLDRAFSCHIIPEAEEQLIGATDDAHVFNN